MSEEAHYTDRHRTTPHSSVDIIQRAIRFVDICGDFEGVLDYADRDDDTGEYQKQLQLLINRAFQIIHSETE